jgi:hypothetical protein
MSQKRDIVVAGHIAAGQAAAIEAFEVARGAPFLLLIERTDEANRGATVAGPVLTCDSTTSTSPPKA